MKIITFGEIMLRLAPPGYLRFVQADTFAATYGGGEANVAVSLANFGMNAEFVTKLPKNELGQSAINSLRSYGVDTSNIARGGDRIGIYFLEKGASMRPSKVIYDRANSSIATAKPTDFDWNAILDGADWFHFTGITPALGTGVVEILTEALKACRERKITVSCDINYRRNLWSRKQARAVMTDLMPYVDVCISNEEDAKDVFGIEADGSDVTSGTLSHDSYREVARRLAEQHGFAKVAITLRSSHSANDNDWAGLLYDSASGECVISPTYPIHIVDRVGGGDSFGAGLIYSCLKGFDNQMAINFAAAASSLKHTIEGDFNLVTVDEVMKLVNGDGSGRVMR